MAKTETELLTVNINGVDRQAKPGMTVLDLTKDLGIKVPTLCHDPRLKPYGACRLCLVELEGARNPVPACATILGPGMVIRTDTEQIHRIRRTVIDLLLSDHPADCMTCEKCGACALQEYAYEYGVRRSSFKAGAKHTVRPQETDPFVARDLSKCILCGRCVRICDEVESAFAIDWIYRGFETQVSTAFGKSLKDTPCEFCGQCISTCPVGALTEAPALPGRTWETKKTLTTCAYCGCGCTLELHTKDNQIVKVASPVGVGTNNGNLCVKGRFGYQFINSPDRLTKPLIKKGGEFVEATWDEAIKIVSDKLGDIKAKHGADAIAGLASAKCTNEENFVFQKFMRAAVGTNNVDHCARLCHASTVTGLAMAFGSGAMSNSIDDLEGTDAILVIGSNTTEAHPVIGMSLLKPVRQKGAKLIVIDPRAIKLTKFADIWLAQKPGTDVAVLNGLMNVILSEGLVDEAFIAERTEDYEELKKILPAYTPEKVEEISGVPADDLRRAARLFAGAGSAAIVYAMGITQHTTGVDNVLTIANLAMITGNIGKPGCGVNPLRGQNNVQGACDMGALPNVYSGYQKVDDDAARAKFSDAWGVPMPEGIGLTVVEVMNAAADGKVKGLYIMGENPMLSDPDVGHVEEALEKLDFLVVQDIFLTETAALADVVLPGVTFAERDGTFTSTERRVQRVRRAIDPVGESREDWRIISDLSLAMGYPMSYDSASDIMTEIAALTPSYTGIGYSRIEGCGLQWPCPSVDHPGTPILHVGQFTRGKGKFHGIEFKPPAEESDVEYPMILTTGRLLNQYHTGTMTRRTAGLDEIYPVAAAEISPKDAKKYGLTDGDKVRLVTRRGQIEATALVTDKSRPGIVFMPFHFKEAAANRLTNPALDPIAKIPEYKVCALRIEKV
ncbi:MAG: formate dehydrogenase subunit alpha [Actinomycetota bacterium]|nr:formate dehydrogenase subunit alpha [Actinomycetota bacterium]